MTDYFSRLMQQTGLAVLPGSPSMPRKTPPPIASTFGEASAEAAPPPPLEQLETVEAPRSFLGESQTMEASRAIAPSQFPAPASPLQMPPVTPPEVPTIQPTESQTVVSSSPSPSVGNPPRSPISPPLQIESVEQRVISARETTPQSPGETPAPAVSGTVRSHPSNPPSPDALIPSPQPHPTLEQIRQTNRQPASAPLSPSPVRALANAQDYWQAVREWVASPPEPLASQVNPPVAPADISSRQPDSDLGSTLLSGEHSRLVPVAPPFLDTPTQTRTARPPEPQGVELSIGTLSLILEAPTPSAPQSPPRPQPASTPERPRRRLNRHYLRVR